MHKTVTPIITVVLLLTALGMLVLMSASSERSLDATYFVQQQLTWLAISLIAQLLWLELIIVYMKIIIPLALISVVSLILVCIPGIGKMVNGSRRWLQIDL